MSGRGYSWPPFEPGNEAAMKHGAESPRRVSPIAERLRAELAESAPWTMGAAFAATVAAWSWAEAQCQLYRQYLDEHGPLDDNGEPRPFLKEMNKAESRAEKLRARLGLDLGSWSALHRTLTTGPDGTTAALDAVRAQGRQMLTATQAAIEAGGEPAGGDTDGR